MEKSVRELTVDELFEEYKRLTEKDSTEQGLDKRDGEDLFYIRERIIDYAVEMHESKKDDTEWFISDYTINVTTPQPRLEMLQLSCFNCNEKAVIKDECLYYDPSDKKIHVLHMPKFCCNCGKHMRNSGKSISFGTCDEFLNDVINNYVVFDCFD